MGAFAAEIARRKQEEEAKAKEQAERQASRESSSYRQKIKANKLAQLEAAWAAVRALANERKQAAINSRLADKEETVEAEMRAYGNKPQELGEAYSQYMAQAAYEAYRAGEVAAHTQITQPKDEKSWWEKAIDTIDKNQALAAIAIGVAVGVGAVAIIATGGVATPLVIGGAALVAGTLTAGGTVALNAHYARPLSQNVSRNIGYTVTSVLATIGIGMAVTGGVVSGAVQQTVYRAGNAVAGYCISNQMVCARAEWAMNALDNIEQGGLMIKGAIQTWRGDIAGAAETQFELQMEYMDGGMPGNAIAREIGEEVSELASKYGDDVVDLFNMYGDDALDIIGAYGDEGISILSHMEAMQSTSLKNMVHLQSPY